MGRLCRLAWRVLPSRSRRYAGKPLAWLPLSGSSRDPTAGETAAQSRKEQSVDVGGALLQLVRSVATSQSSAMLLADLVAEDLSRPR
jgi:hypothetical protein